MISKARDFYHTQDELNLAWRYLARSQVSASIELDALSAEIESISESLQITYSKSKMLYQSSWVSWVKNLKV